MKDVRDRDRERSEDRGSAGRPDDQDEEDRKGKRALTIVILTDGSQAHLAYLQTLQGLSMSLTQPTKHVYSAVSVVHSGPVSADKVVATFPRRIIYGGMISGKTNRT